MKVFTLVFILLLSFNCWPHSLKIENKPTIYLVTQNPLGAYYGDRVANHLAKSFKDHQINTYYLNMDIGTSDSNINYLLNLIVDDINKVNPSFVFVHNSGLTVALKKELGSKYIISDFSVTNTKDDVLLEDPITKLISILDAFDYTVGKYYIITDKTNQSKRNSSLFKRLLKANKVKDVDIEILEVSDAKNLTKELNRLNGLPKGVIFNALYLLRDNELNKIKYAVELKNQLTEFNKKHIDVSPYLSVGGNEALIFLIDLNQANSFFKKYINKSSDSEIERANFKVLLNVDRFDKLGLKEHYMKNINVIDGVIYDKH
jgi:hypothetical protein